MLGYRRDFPMGPWLVSLLVSASLIAACAPAPHVDAAALAKKLLDERAAHTAAALFGTDYDSAHSRLIDAKSMRRWLEEQQVKQAQLPERVRQALGAPDAVGLLVPGVVRFADADGGPGVADDVGTRAMDMPGIFLPLFPGGFWIHGSGPCNGDFCLNCTGCEGLGSDGMFHSCVCTNSCRTCRDCPKCT